MNLYEPELGQAVWGNPTGEYDIPDYADALIAGLLNEIERVYWNVNQQEWESYEDPCIPGLAYRPYWWGDTEAPEASLPNFAFDGVEVRWYKRPGRGMSCNKALSPNEWTDWFARCLRAIQAADVRDV